jgi:phage-related protein
MTTLPRCTLFLLVGLIAGPLFCSTVAAQTDAQPEKQTSTVAPPPAVSIPPTPNFKSPVDRFRELLAMNNQQREIFLTNQPVKASQRLLVKVNEYQAMKPDERELRLRATQLRWYLLRFMNMPAVNRQAQISLIQDPADRQFLEYRLQLWDDLSPQQQKDVLEYETAVQYLDHPSASHTNDINALPGKQREEMVKKINTWQSLPSSQREQMYAHFQKFFELTDDEKQKALRSLPETERQQIDKTLKSFAHLPKEKREKCVRSFQKFAGMSPEEREQFLKNAERWKEMTPAERESWRNLVARLPALPPLPPGLSAPPLPPTAHRRPASPPLPLVTNGVR